MSLFFWNFIKEWWVFWKMCIWRPNNMLLNNQQIIEEIKKEIKICIEMNENENTTTQNLWDTVKAVLRARFIALQAYLKKQGKSQINNLTLHLKHLEKEEMKNPRVSRRKEILKIRAEINAKETKNRKQQRFFYSSIFSLKFSKDLFFQLKLFIIWKLIELSSVSIRTLPPLMSDVLRECISRKYLICNWSFVYTQVK